MDIYYFNITPLRNKFIFERNLSKVSKKRQEKIARLKRNDDKLRCLGAGLLIEFIKEKYNINDEIVIDKFGKPHFLRTKDSFNISHSGNYVVIAVSRFNIGIDIQRMEKNNQLVAERNFHQNECTYINEGEDENVKTQRFYEVWTVKEAYLKNVGIGLRKPLNSFEVNFAEGKAKIMDNPGYEILQMKLDERYIMSVCADIRDKELNIEEVGIFKKVFTLIYIKVKTFCIMGNSHIDFIFFNSPSDRRLHMEHQSVRCYIKSDFFGSNVTTKFFNNGCINHIT